MASSEELEIIKKLIQHGSQRPTDHHEIDKLKYQLVTKEQTDKDAFWVSSDSICKDINIKFIRCWTEFLISNSEIEKDILLVLLTRTIYWLLLQQGLSNPSTEKQKLCLYIFKRSVIIFKSHNLDENHIIPTDNPSIDRFCFVYETTIFGRNTNQIDECLKSVPHDVFISKSSTILNTEWWIPFFSAALQLKDSPNVAKRVGTNLMNQCLRGFKYSKQFEKLIFEPFINWSSQQTLFVGSIKRSGYIITCEHGEQLRNFITNIVNQLDQNFLREFSQLSLERLSKKYYNEHALGYIIQGLNIHAYKDTTNDVPKSITNITQPFLKHSACGSFVKSILDFHLTCISKSLSLKLETYEERSINSLVETELSKINDIPKLEEFLLNPDIKLHENNGFTEFCNRLQYVLDTHSLSSMDTKHLISIFETFLIILDRKAYVKPVGDALPALLYSKSILSMSKHDSNLREFLYSMTMRLFEYSQKKIQFWNPLVSAFRLAYLETETFSDIVKLDNILTMFAKNPPCPSDRYLLDCALSHDLQTYRAPSDLSIFADESFGNLCLFDIMNRLRERDHSYAVLIIRDFLQLWNDSTLHERTVTFHQQITTFQTILILSGRVIKHSTDGTALRRSIVTLLAMELAPAMRYLLHWVFASSFWSLKNLEEIEDMILNALTKSLEEDIMAMEVVSYLRLSTYLAQHEHVSSNFIMQLMKLLPTFCSMDKIAVRLEARWTVPKMMKIINNIQTTSSAAEPIHLDESIKTLYDYTISLKKFQEPPRQWILQVFDPCKDQNLHHLFKGAFLELDHIAPASTFEIDVMRLLQAQSTLSENDIPSAHYAYLPENMTNSFSSLNLNQSISQLRLHTTAAPPSPPPQAGPFIQTKSFTPLPLPLTSSGATSSSSSSTPRTPILLLASLISSPYNLGGLARISEIYRLHSLHIASLRTTLTPEFQSTALAAESHLPITETPVAAAAALVRRLKQNASRGSDGSDGGDGGDGGGDGDDGWRVLGVEQTDASQELGRTGFLAHKDWWRRKVVLIMGAESTGISPELLVLCDACVQIKQWGVTRSLNVQTAAATVLFEIMRQWDM